MVLSLLHGTSKFLELENIDFTEVINKVASKGGTTEEALSFFNNNKKLQSFLEKGISMAERKSRFLSGE